MNIIIFSSNHLDIGFFGHGVVLALLLEAQKLKILDRLQMPSTVSILYIQKKPEMSLEVVVNLLKCQAACTQ